MSNNKKRNSSKSVSNAEQPKKHNPKLKTRKASVESNKESVVVNNVMTENSEIATPNKPNNFLDKFWHLSESNLFWGGGIALIIAGIGFLIFNESVVFSAILLGIGWIMLTVSMYKYKIFESKTQKTQILLTTSISISILIFLFILWFLLKPIPSLSNEKFTFIREVSPTTYRDLPFVLKITIQSTVKVQPVHFKVVCEDEIGRGQAGIIGAGVYLDIFEKTEKNTYEFGFGSPALTPQSPAIIKIFSKTKLQCNQIIALD